MTLSFRTTSFHNFKKKFGFLLKFFPNILKKIVPTGLEKTANGSKIRFSEQKLWFNWLRRFLLENLAEFLLVFACTCLHNQGLIVMSY